MPSMDTSRHRLTRRQVIERLLAPGILSLAVLSGAGGQAPRRATIARTDATPPAWLTLPPTPALPAARRSGLAAVNGTKIFFAQFGEGPPVLLLHGGLGNSNHWGYQVAELAKTHSVTVMDTRGHGRSPVTSRSFNYGLFAEDVAALLDFLQIPAAAIVGWSDGAITALQLGLTKPERVSRLFSFGGNVSLDGMNPSSGSSQMFAAYAARCKTEYAELSPTPDKWPELRAGLRTMWRTQPTFPRQKLAALKMPVTISAGEHDEIIKREHTEYMARVVPGARLVILPGVSHFAMLQNPAQFNKALLDFLAAKN